MVAHLETCVASHDKAGPSKPLIVFRIDAAHDPRYWIYVEARADATLRQLDSFLRHLWLECCGHMSAFYVDRRELAMSAVAGIAFCSPGAKFRYEYDFGSTTSLTGQVLSSRHGSIGRLSVRLLARNEPLEWSCAQCAAPATTICPYCLDTDECLFCDTHAEAHEHAGEEVYLPVVNSPRMGVCAYAG
jgi:hypothetical protein